MSNLYRLLEVKASKFGGIVGVDRKAGSDMSTNSYQAVLVLNPDLDDQGVKDQIEKVAVVAAAHGGSVEKSDIWGRRQLAYKIKKKDYGIYVVLVVGGDSSIVSDLDRQLKINDQVLRHLVVKKDKHAPEGAAYLRDGGDLPAFVTDEGRGGDELDDDDDGVGASV